MSDIHEIAVWIGVATSFVGGIYYLSRQIDGKLTSAEYFARHRELEERIRRLELWAASLHDGFVGKID